MTKNSLCFILKKTMRKFMKKILPLILSVPALLLSSCKSEQVDKSKICLDYGSYHNDELEDWTQFDELDYDNLDALITSKENFVLLTFHNRSCGCWTDFGIVAVKYANKYHYDFRIFDVAELSGHKEKFGIYSGEDLMPGICFFRRGKLIRQTIFGKLSENNQRIFKRLDLFEQFMDKNIYLPKMYWLEQEVLDDKLDHNEELNLYVAKKTCEDCNYVNKNYLYKWSSKNFTLEKPLYLFDIEIFQTGDYPEGYYQQMKDRYGLSVTGNPTFGYGNGYVPTFQHRVGWTIQDMITILNDSVEKVEDKFVIHSYFTETRVNNSQTLSQDSEKYILEGKYASDSDVEETAWEGYYRFTQKGQYKMHKATLELFFSTYVK